MAGNTTQRDERKLTTSKNLSPLHNSTECILLRVQQLDIRPVHRPRSTALLPAVRVVGNVCRKHDWNCLEHLRLHRSTSRPGSQPQVFHAGRVSIVWCDSTAADVCSYDTPSALSTYITSTKCKLKCQSNPRRFVTYNNSVSMTIGVVGGILLADRRMWAQYVADVGSAAAEQVEAASVRTSLRRMSHAILVLENENGQGAAAVLPVEEEKEESETSAGSTEANDDDTDDELGSEDKKGSSFVNTLVTLGNTIVIFLIAVGYPVAVLPYYRAESTTEWVFSPLASMLNQQSTSIYERTPHSPPNCFFLNLICV